MFYILFRLSVYIIFKLSKISKTYNTFCALNIFLLLYTFSELNHYIMFEVFMLYGAFYILYVFNMYYFIIMVFSYLTF